VSHTAVAQRLRDGELLRGRRPSDVDLDDLVDVASRLRRETPRRLADLLRARVSEGDRRVAARAGLEPALLARWLRKGVVRADGQGELTRAEHRWLADNGSLVREIDEATRTVDAIDTVVLFGSRARGDQRPDSDVDLIVDGTISGDARALAVMRGELLERLGHDVEISTLAEARAAPVVLLEAIHEGRVLKDTAGRWQATVADSGAIQRQAADERATYEARERIALEALGVRA
jgi:predicted nucleotidyltransferase